MDPSLVLGLLIAAIKQVPWQVNLMGEEVAVWPTTPQPGPDDLDDEDNPWVTGPWVLELDTTVRDTLAGVQDADLSKAVAEWVQAEELDGWSAEEMQPVVEELIQLARRARDAGEQVYCGSACRRRGEVFLTARHAALWWHPPGPHMARDD